MVLNVFFCKCIEKFICIVIFFSKNMNNCHKSPCSYEIILVYINIFNRLIDLNKLNIN